jgi:nucleoid-associated protein YgaU
MYRQLIFCIGLCGFFALQMTSAVADEYEQQLKQEASVTRMEGAVGTPTTTGVEPAVTLQPQVDGEAMAAEISFELEQALRKNQPAPAPVSAEPPVAPVSGGESSKIRLHIVKSDESLSLIALQYYKDRLKYWKIYQANQALLSNPDLILSGQRLVIPE